MSQIDRDAVAIGDDITYTPPSGRGQSIAAVEYTTHSAVHVITAERRHYPVHWHRVTGHFPRKTCPQGHPMRWEPKALAWVHVNETDNITCRTTFSEDEVT